MPDELKSKLGRRDFFKGAAILAAGAATTVAEAQTPPAAPSAAPVTPSASTAATPAPAPAAGYESFGPDEAGFVEAMVTVMCPADNLTPNGVDCGVAVYIDRQLAGGFGQGERLYMHGPWKKGKPQLGYQMPLAPEQYFKFGLAVADAAANKRFGKAFAALATADADTFLHDIAGGKVTDDRIDLASWFNETVYPLFAQGCFADPIYGGNVNKVFWKMIGYPGLPAVHTLDMVNYLGKPDPDGQNPKSIADLS